MKNSKKVKLILVLSILFWCSKSIAFEFSGYLSNDFKYSSLDERSLLNKNNILDIEPFTYVIKFRTRGKDKISKDFIHYYFKVRGELNFNEDYDIFKKDNVYYEGKSFFTVDELYLDSEVSPNVYFLLGKERVIWGNGLIWNPADVINPSKELRNPKHDEEGAYIAKGEFSFQSFSLSLYYHSIFINEDNEFGKSSSNAALKLNFFISGIELNTYYYQRLESQKYSKDPVFGFTVNYLFPIFDLNFYSDIVYERNSEYTYFRKKNDNYETFIKEGEEIFSGIFGITYIYQGNIQFNFGIEYFHNGKGCTKKEREDYFGKLSSLYEQKEYREAEIKKMQNKEGEYQDFEEEELEKRINDFECKVQEIEGNIKGTLDLNKDDYLNRDYIGFRIRFAEIANLIDFNNTILFSLPDLGFCYVTEVEFHVFETVSLKLSSTLFEGKRKDYSQFGNNPITKSLEGSIKFVF